MKTLKLAVAVASLMCLNAVADITLNLDPVVTDVTNAVIGGAVGYVAKKQLALWARNSAQAKTLDKISYAGQGLVISGAALSAAAGAIFVANIDAEGKINSDELCRAASVATLSLIATAVATQTPEEEDDFAQAYAQATAE